jgi:glucose/arabinose dehydrogenase
MLCRLATLVALFILASCSERARSDASSGSDPNGTDVDGAGGLRSNVQDGVAPNADGQRPAFPEQTRAPRPAQPTAFAAEVFARGLQIPWGIAELPDGRLLVTERAGRLRVIGPDGAIGAPIDGVPAVAAVGQGGLLDVAISPDFAPARRVYLTFAEDRGGGRRAPSVARGTLSPDETSLDGVEVIYRQQPAWEAARHFGSRLVFDPDGLLYVTFGDRGVGGPEAQDPGNAIGAVIRIRPDGSVPPDNPFVGRAGAAPEVWSFGHRNIQAATLGTDGALWTVEHGPQGGDELNRPQRGANHGWPIITYGENYDGRPVGDGLTAKDGMVQPIYYWDPVIAPSGMATYEGDRFEGWSGDLLVGGLQAEALVRLTVREGRVVTEEWLPLGARVRSVAVARDGAVLVGTDKGEILRLVPSEA